jgi:hypothetical protein
MSATILACPDFLAGYAGIPNLVYKGRRLKRSAQYGLTFRYDFEGLPAAVAVAFASVSADQDAETEEYGPIHRLTISTADDPSSASSSEVTTTFEIPGNSLQKDIREHPRSLALTPATVKLIDDVLEGALDANNVPISASLIPAGDATTLYNLLRQRNRQMSFFVPQYVFRLNQVFSKRNENAVINAAYAGVGKVYSTSQVITETNPTSAYVSALTKISTVTSYGSATGHTFGWLKQTPILGNAPGGRNSISIEYWLYTYETSFVYTTP